MGNLSKADRADHERLRVQFEMFYNACLVRSLGKRTGSTALLVHYLAWAERAGAGSLNHRELRTLMQDRGHRRLASDGMHYLDVEIRQPLGSPTPDPIPHAVTRRLDEILMDVARIKLALGIG